jgi:hypothetical protein
MHNETQSSEDYIKDVLHLSEGMRVESIISFGYPDETKEPIPREELEYEKIV